MRPAEACDMQMNVLRTLWAILVIGKVGSVGPRLLLIRIARRSGWLLRLLLLLLAVDVFGLRMHVHCLCQMGNFQQLQCVGGVVDVDRMSDI